MRTPKPNTKSRSIRRPPSQQRSSAVAAALELRDLIDRSTRLWRKHHLNYDQVRYLTKQVRQRLGISRPPGRRRFISRLTAQEQHAFIRTAYKQRGPRGLMMKVLLQTGSRVSEFVGLDVADVLPDECTILIRRGKGGKARNVPILPDLAQELRTFLGRRGRGPLFETNRFARFSPRRIQQIVKHVADTAGLQKRVHPHLLRHTIATHLLEHGMSIDKIQKFLGHDRIDTTQLYAEASPESIRGAYERAMRAVPAP